MSAHALLGPSSADRWLTCTPSARASEHEPDSRSAYADEGTFAHAVAEHCLKNLLRPEQLCGTQPWEGSEYWTQDLRDHVCTYLDYIAEVLDGCSEEAHVEIEVKLDLTPWAPESFGTADCCVIDHDTLHVIDLKFGKGVPVDAHDNSQLKLYALGALHAFAFIYSIKKVVMHIVQPRI